MAHDLVEDSYEELTYAGNRVVNSTAWTDVGKTQKIRETQISYTGNKVTQTIDIQYDAAGVELYRLTQVLTYNGNRVADITTTRTP